MARIELPSGVWVEYRDKLLAGDKFRVMGSFAITSDENGKSQFPSGSVNIFRNALLTEIITAWGGPEFEGIPIPSANIDPEAVLGRFDIDDYNELAEAVQPLLDKVVKAGPNQPGPKRTQGSSSG